MPIGHAQTKETRAKISASLKGVKKSAEALKNMRANFAKPWLGIPEEQHPNYRGGNISYRRFHQWLDKNFGKANKCENKKCTYPQITARKKILYKPSRFHWALLSGKNYQRKRENYVMLCALCHSRYDVMGKKIWL